MPGTPIVTAKGLPLPDVVRDRVKVLFRAGVTHVNVAADCQISVNQVRRMKRIWLQKGEVFKQPKKSGRPRTKDPSDTTRRRWAKETADREARERDRAERIREEEEKRRQERHSGDVVGGGAQLGSATSLALLLQPTQPLPQETVSPPSLPEQKLPPLQIQRILLPADCVKDSVWSQDRLPADSGLPSTGWYVTWKTLSNEYLLEREMYGLGFGHAIWLPHKQRSALNATVLEISTDFLSYMDMLKRDPCSARWRWRERKNIGRDPPTCYCLLPPDTENASGSNPGIPRPKIRKPRPSTAGEKRGRGRPRKHVIPGEFDLEQDEVVLDLSTADSPNVRINFEPDLSTANTPQHLTEWVLDPSTNEIRFAFGYGVP